MFAASRQPPVHNPWHINTSSKVSQILIYYINTISWLGCLDLVKIQLDSFVGQIRAPLCKIFATNSRPPAFQGCHVVWLDLTAELVGDHDVCLYSCPSIMQHGQVTG
jgi:hypothetical protein